PDRVFCGPGTCDSTQDACCLQPSSGPVCMPAAQSCTGVALFTCDGPEDCMTGHCCLIPVTLDGGATQVTTVCRADCAMAPTELSPTAGESPSHHAACCHGPDSPLGHCLPPEHAPNGELCDVR